MMLERISMFLGYVDDGDQWTIRRSCASNRSESSAALNLSRKWPSTRPRSPERLKYCLERDQIVIFLGQGGSSWTFRTRSIRRKRVALSVLGALASILVAIYLGISWFTAEQLTRATNYPLPIDPRRLSATRSLGRFKRPIA